MNIDELVARYRQAAVKHGEATAAGNHRLANKQHDIVERCYSELKKLGAEGRERLVALTEDHNPWVRAWAAVHCLTYREDVAIRVLEELASVPGLIGFSSQMTLSEWRKGNLTNL